MPPSFCPGMLRSRPTRKRNSHLENKSSVGTFFDLCRWVCSYATAAIRLRRQAEATGLFTSAVHFDFDKLRSMYPDFWSKTGRFILENQRGAGYWIWKPFLISERLNEIRDGEFLVYADAGCEVSCGDPEKLHAFLPVESHFDLAATVLEPFRTVIRWTNAYCRSMLDETDCYRDLPQIQASLLAIKNNANTRTLSKRWLFWSTYDRFSLIIDRSGELEDPLFIEHRHDQSVLSLLIYDLERSRGLSIKKLDVQEAHKSNFFMPILRNKSPLSLLRGNTIKRRIVEKIYLKSMRIMGRREERRLRKLREVLASVTAVVH